MINSKIEQMVVNIIILTKIYGYKLIIVKWLIEMNKIYWNRSQVTISYINELINLQIPPDKYPHLELDTTFFFFTKSSTTHLKYEESIDEN
jgi:hypothetical protein